MYNCVKHRLKREAIQEKMLSPSLSQTIPPIIQLPLVPIEYQSKSILSFEYNENGILKSVKVEPIQ